MECCCCPDRASASCVGRRSGGNREASTVSRNPASGHSCRNCADPGSLSAAQSRWPRAIAGGTRRIRSTGTSCDTVCFQGPGRRTSCCSGRSGCACFQRGNSAYRRRAISLSGRSLCGYDCCSLCCSGSERRSGTRSCWSAVGDGEDFGCRSQFRCLRQWSWWRSTGGSWNTGAWCAGPAGAGRSHRVGQCRRGLAHD
jgi:hypothetical protein